MVDFTFRQLYAFFIIELGSRRVVHVGVTRHPTDAWVAQQLREATPFEDHPTYLIRATMTASWPCNLPALPVVVPSRF